RPPAALECKRRARPARDKCAAAAHGLHAIGAGGAGVAFAPSRAAAGGLACRHGRCNPGRSDPRFRMPATRLPPGADPLRNPALNKGTAFTVVERDALGLHGLLPPRVCTLEEQIVRALENLRRKESPLEKYIFLTALQGRNQTLFYRVLMDHLEELMPIVYTPTVGEACQSYGQIFRQATGLYVSRNDRGRIARVLRNWRSPGQVRAIVVT